jgi:NAD(P)-dependent dehydrogenase (short-subunit alcohol dehydrogenase family)
VDAADEPGVKSAFSAVKEKHERIHGVVSCIGSVCLKPLQSVTVAEFSEVFKVNTLTAFCILKAACTVMSEQMGGSIVFCSSTASLIGLAHHEAIAGSRRGE